MSTINIDDIVYTVKGKNAKALAVVEEIQTGSRLMGRYGSKPVNNRVTYIARYADGKVLKFHQEHINKTVFKMEDEE